jgi:hypothetical protein
LALHPLLALGSFVCLNDAVEPAGERQGPDWTSALYEEILSHGTGNGNNLYAA